MTEDKRLKEIRKYIDEWEWPKPTAPTAYILDEVNFLLSEIDRLKEELEMMKFERDSETRWASDYFKQSQSLEVKLKEAEEGLDWLIGYVNTEIRDHIYNPKFMNPQKKVKKFEKLLSSIRDEGGKE